MSFKLKQLNAIELIAQERLYLAADGKTVVKEGDPLAASLLAGIGQVIPRHLVTRLGLKDAIAAETPTDDPKERSTRVITPKTR